MRRLALVALLALLAVFAVRAPAWAWWTDNASGTATITAGTLQPPTFVSCTNRTLSTPTIIWSAPTAGVAPTGYTITMKGVSGLASGTTKTTTSTSTTWNFDGGLANLLGGWDVTVQSTYQGWKSATSTWTQHVTVTAVVAGLGVASCG